MKTYSIEEQFAAVKAHTSQDLHGFGKKTNMEHRFGKVQMTKVPRAVSHVASTRGAASVPVNASLSGIHQPSQLRSAILVYFRVFDSSFCGRHSSLKHKITLWAFTQVRDKLHH